MSLKTVAVFRIQFIYKSELMRQRLVLLVLISLYSIFNLAGQSPAKIFYFDHIPASLDTVMEGWRYKPGDNPAWADPSLDDNDWKEADAETKKDIRFFIQSHPEHIGWFRLKFRVADSLRKKNLSLLFEAYGATEIYLNGQLIKRNGKIAPDPRDVKAVSMENTPISIHLAAQDTQVLAVRFAYQKGIPYLSDLWDMFTMKAMIGTPESIHETSLAIRRVPIQILMGSILGLFFILTVLHSFFYAYYRKRKENLYYAIYCFTVFMLWSLLVAYVNEPNLGTRMWMAFFIQFIAVFYYTFYVLTIYRLFRYTGRKALKILLLASVLILPFAFYGQYPLIKLVNNLWPSIYIAEAFRVSLLTNRTNRTVVSNILTKGTFIFLFLSVVANICITFFLGSNTGEVSSLIIISFVVNIVMMSIIVALQVGVTSKTLERKLKEVEDMAREKQDLLINQNVILEEQVAIRTSELNESIQHLQATQHKLIQSEKMASLGQLTAGIAHEIQNPLNFVNNFSEVNTELLAEMKHEIEKGNKQEANSIADDVIENQEKINYHGKRAEAIVKGMLMHSRTGTNEKEATNINALSGKYLQLAYQGHRAKDKSFKAKLETGFDESLGQVHVIPQDIGRVILNLVNNAFYAVSEKTAWASGRGESYEPTVSFNVSKVDQHVVISVKDNGNGISSTVLDKIFQPFFTTKPTGQGTGLGLSISYDIVNAHGGEIQVATMEGKGSEFIVYLPIG